MTHSSSTSLPPLLPVPSSASPFHGSYPASDVTFLLRQTHLAPTPIEEKEQLIQTGQRHYSQMIGVEVAPSAAHLHLYHTALAEGLARLAQEVQWLALTLQQRRPQRPIVLVSFVRAGVPLGVLLLRALRDQGVACVHYGISIIRDKGIDHAALAWIEQRHDVADLVFVDGWVGKGAILKQLQASIGARYAPQPIPFVVLADPTGTAWLAASGDDWLIPFGILGATVSGLVSRSILTSDGGWHACLYYEQLATADLSNHFISTVNTWRQQHKVAPSAVSLSTLAWEEDQRLALRKASQQTLERLVNTYHITNLNLIKPGIAEATRAVMRRVPEQILVQDLQDPHIRLLQHLAESKGVRISEASIAPYRAITLIKRTL